MEIQDDRTTGQKQTHPVLIVGTDRFMSDWGKASGGKSYAAWACTLAERCDCRRWVESRRDMARVRETTDPYRPKGRGHLHIYVWTA